ncbi:FAM32A [Brachionus plicatilis]|uniref:FAM32A n=1 Tax=Brachionus plicatilis TaxID=10195 RepID=A0A3M7S9L4_BRAPC|nr:FAM32A [Brachionus plicatilis]
MSYECSGGSLRLKGVSDKKIKKKKKSKIDPDLIKQELALPKVSRPELDDPNSNGSFKEAEQGNETRKISKTKAELAFERIQEMRNQDKVIKRAEKSHKERVELYNKHLDSLSEYNDIPKVSWTK